MPRRKDPGGVSTALSAHPCPSRYVRGPQCGRKNQICQNGREEGLGGQHASAFKIKEWCEAKKIKVGENNERDPERRSNNPRLK